MIPCSAVLALKFAFEFRDGFAAKDKDRVELVPDGFTLGGTFRLEFEQLGNEISDMRLSDRFASIVDLLGKPDPVNLDYQTIPSFDVLNKDDFKRLNKTLLEKNYDVLIIDPLIMFHGRDENSAMGMKEVFVKFNELISRHDLSVVLVHHFSKANQFSFGNDPDRMRGSGSLKGWVDTAITLHKKMSGIDVNWKIRNAEKPERLTLKRVNGYFEVVNKDSKKLTVNDLVKVFNDSKKSSLTKVEVVKAVGAADHCRGKPCSESTVRSLLKTGKKKYFKCDKKVKPNAWSLR